jgi:flagellin
MYKFAGDGGFEPVAGGTQTITVKVGTQQIGIDLIATTTLNQAISQINAKTSAMGVYAVKTADGADFSFYSASSFKVSTADTAATAGWGTAVVAGLAEDGATAGSGVGQSATASAEAAITAITNAVGKLGVVQGKVGTGQNQLQYAINLAQSQISNFSAAESRIRDADVAAEAANLTKAQVLQQASLAAMAQANSAPQAVLALLRG